VIHWTGHGRGWAFRGPCPVVIQADTIDGKESGCYRVMVPSGKAKWRELSRHQTFRRARRAADEWIRSTPRCPEWTVTRADRRRR